MSMFCYQCEQTMKGTGCTMQGVCGKDPKVAALQDLTVYGLEGLAMYAHRARAGGMSNREIDVFVLEALFSTVTNVNFDAERFEGLLRRLATMKDRARELYEESCTKAGTEPEALAGPAAWTPASTLEGLVKQGEGVGIPQRREKLGDDIAGLRELVTYGLKGMAAYADHAHILGQDDESVYAFFIEALDTLAEASPSADDLVALALKCGEVNVKVLELLDRANAGTYGQPEPTQVRVTPVKGKAILVSGHDLKDLAELLEQTQGTGINVYTHGEMLPCHAYPELKKYEHLVGNYGGAWQDQQKEFDAFPGPILMTTNCIQRPQKSYQDRIFTTGLVGWPGVMHVGKRRDGKTKDFRPVIEAARSSEGFSEDGTDKKITVGFGHHAVMGVADKVIEAVKGGAIKHFFLVGGCDGAKPGRNYYTEFAEKVPDDCVILTLACGKYRFNKLDFGDIGGIPRLLDIGQCNDAYSAVQVALALAKAFDCGVNDLPLSLVLSWYEQKAVAILLTLLHLGIKNIKIGPSLPAFVTPNVLNLLVEKWGIKPISTPEEDLRAILG